MTIFKMRHITLILALIFMQAGFQAIYGQKIPALEPVSDTYKPISALSGLPDRQRQALDTVQFPWTEYSKGAIGNALWRTVYLSAENEAQLPGLIQLPANSSEQTRAELDYLLNLQKTRTKKEIDRAEYIAGIGSWPNIINPTDPDYHGNFQNLYYIVSTATGKPYDYRSYPATTKLLLNCIQDIRVTEFRLKQVFKRPRPYHLEPTLQPLARINSPSFPSGHSLWAYTEAYIFGLLDPGQRQKFIETAAEVRWSRELLGIHFPGDNEASRIIGWHLVNFWHSNPRFIADLEAARHEWTTKNTGLE